MRYLKHLVSALAFSLAAAAPAWAGERLNQILDTKVLRVGTPGDYRPFAINEVPSKT